MNIIPKIEYRKQSYSNENKLMDDIKKRSVGEMLQTSLKRLMWESPPFILFFLSSVSTALGIAFIYSQFIK